MSLFWKILPLPIRVILIILCIIAFFLIIFILSSKSPAIWLCGILGLIILTPLLAFFGRKNLELLGLEERPRSFIAKKDIYVKVRNSFVSIIVVACLSFLFTKQDCLANFSLAHLDRNTYSIETLYDDDLNIEKVVKFHFNNIFLNIIANNIGLIYTIFSAISLLVIYSIYQKQIEQLKKKALENGEMRI